MDVCWYAKVYPNIKFLPLFGRIDIGIKLIIALSTLRQEKKTSIAATKS